MPLEVECHTVPHLKASTCGMKHRSGNWRASILGGKNQFKKYSFHFINRPSGGFIWPYLYLYQFSHLSVYVASVCCLFVTLQSFIALVALLAWNLFHWKWTRNFKRFWFHISTNFLSKSITLDMLTRGLTCRGRVDPTLMLIRHSSSNICLTDRKKG